MIYYVKRKSSHLKNALKEGENIINDKAEIAHKFNNFILQMLGQILQIR